MGQVESILKPPEDIYPFCAVSQKYLERLILFIKSDSDGTFKLSRWQLLSFTGTERLAEVTKLFRLFERSEKKRLLSLQQFAAAQSAVNQVGTYYFFQQI